MALQLKLKTPALAHYQGISNGLLAAAVFIWSSVDKMHCSSGSRSSQRRLVTRVTVWLLSLAYFYRTASQIRFTTPSPLPTPALQQTATEHQKLAGQNQIQLSHATAMNRYPDEYSAAQNYFRTLVSESSGSMNKKLLSFGASTGEEAITLASMYFMNSMFTIFGVDLDEDSLDKAKASAVAHSPKFDDNKIMFFNGKTTDISVHGPYDAIFANSVLCYHGDRNVNPQSILNKFPFSAFEDSIQL